MTLDGVWRDRLPHTRRLAQVDLSLFERETTGAPRAKLAEAFEPPQQALQFPGSCARRNDHVKHLIFRIADVRQVTMSPCGSAVISLVSGDERRKRDAIAPLSLTTSHDGSPQRPCHLEGRCPIDPAIDDAERDGATSLGRGRHQAETQEAAVAQYERAQDGSIEPDLGVPEAPRGESGS